jgi:hypothetical protein
MGSPAQQHEYPARWAYRWFGGRLRLDIMREPVEIECVEQEVEAVKKPSYADDRAA